jgi:transposase
MAIEGATDTEVFRTYIREILCPTIRAGDVVITDNLSPHKSEATLELLRQRGAQVLLLPAYSPDLNPIKKMWSKIKTYIRTAEARTLSDLVEAIGIALKNVISQDAVSWFVSCGYSFIEFAIGHRNSL